MRWNRAGVSREVFLVGPWATKLPKLTYRWRNFLWGLLANMQERDYYTTECAGLCPVVWAAPGGFVVVMKRARPLTEQEWEDFDVDAFFNEYEVHANLIIPAEMKRDSFGWYNGKIVAVDYG